MTYNQLHKYQYNLSKVLSEKFKEQLLEIHPRAHLCYQSHCEKFTISLFDIPYEESTAVWNDVSTEHLTLISEYAITPSIEQLCHDLTKFIMNKGPEHDHIINHST